MIKNVAFIVAGAVWLAGCKENPTPVVPPPELPSVDTRKILDSPGYKNAVAEAMAVQDKEQKVLEDAPWIGKTGLSGERERELPRYLRREFGQTIFDQGSLKAANLSYVGRFDEKGEVVHY